MPPFSTAGLSRQQRQIFISEDLDTCTHVFVRRYTVRAPLVPPYDGPFEVISRIDKTCTVNINSRHDVVTLDPAKPAYLDSFLTDPSVPCWKISMMER
ncbi:unnamed protein product [Ixodes pacificus]